MSEQELLEQAYAFMTQPLNAPTAPTLEPGRHLLAELGYPVTQTPFPTITVVGSKGKGTTTIAASAALAGAGLCVGTITSPSFITPRERIRINGEPISSEDYLEIVNELRAAYDRLSAQHPDWLLPRLGGLSLIGGMKHFTDQRVDVAVLEASMGGGSDLTAIIESPVVVITEVFGEHLGSLGDTVAEIGVEKLKAVTAKTKKVITVQQSPEVLAAWEASGILDGVEVTVVPFGPFGHHPNKLTDRNLELGRVAAQQWRHLYDSLDPDTCSEKTSFKKSTTYELPTTLTLPGRCQQLPQSSMVDCAISASGAVAAIEQYRHAYGKNPEHIFVMLPHSKDDTGVFEVLQQYPIPYTAVSMTHLAEHLWPNPDLWPQLVTFDDTALSEQANFLAFGTVSFAAAVMKAKNQTADFLW